MKKTISINISGVIFHIEEDGYDKLKGYLASIQQYFSTYEDSQEIITDIENRIAEKLLQKLKGDANQPARQAVTQDDVNELIRSMGTIADFEAVEEDDMLGHASAGSSRQQSAYGSASAGMGGAATATASSTTTRTSAPRKLYRDLKRKLLGGVASGTAHYFNIDPVWVRLIFVTLVFVLPPLGEGAGAGISGFAIILYIAMWIAFPGSMNLEEDQGIKKFYRNPDDKVLGGVASGLAAYFGQDTGVIRLLFVLGILLFGTGLMAYIILWIISPVAKTMTEKMEMKGQPITLTNIESNIKRSLHINETAEESTLTKVLLFPFRLIATVVGGMGRILSPFLRAIGTIIRVFVGVLLVVVGGAFMIAALGLAGAAIGMRGLGQTGDFPIELIQQDLSGPMILAGFVALFIPGLALALLGVTMIAQRSLVSTRVSLAILSVWFLSLLGLAATVPPLINDFNRSGTFEEATAVNPTGLPTLALNGSANDDITFRPSIELEGYEGTTWRVVKRYRAQGSTRKEAQQNAQAAIYNFTAQDSLMRFDNEYEIKAGARWRVQDIDVIVQVPYEKPFRMTEDFARYIRNDFGSREIGLMKTSVWKFTKADGLVNVGGPRDFDYNREEDFDTDDAIDNALRDEFGDDFDDRGESNRQFDVTNFSKVDVGGAFTVRIRRGNVYKVIADGREDDIDELRVRVTGNELNVDFRNGGLFQFRNRRQIGLTIVMPDVERVELSGATKASLVGFENLDRLDVDLSGACRALVDAKVADLKLNLSGASKATLRGRADRLDADLSGACQLDATASRVGRADVEASGASTADFGEVTDLNSRTSGASKVHGAESRGDEQPME